MQIDFTNIPRGTKVPGIVTPKMSHGIGVAHVRTGDELLQDIDAIWTENPSLTLGVTTADCAAIAAFDGERVGIAHVGWRGLAAGMIPTFLAVFDGASLQVHLGPHLHSFEVQRDACYDALSASFGERFFNEREGKIMFDFSAALLFQLPAHTTVDSRNTETDLSLPSYRHGRNNERLLTTVRFSKATDKISLR